MDSALISKQPENYRPLLKRSVRLYRLGFKKVALLALLLSITVFIPRLLSILIGQDILHSLHFFGLAQLWMAIINLVCFIFFVGIVWHMHCVLINKRDPFIQDVEIGLKKSITVFIASLLQGFVITVIVAAIIGSQALVYRYQPWIFENQLSLWLIGIVFLGEVTFLTYIATLFVFILPLIAIENKGIISAIKKSVILVWNHWWRTITLQSTPWLCFIFTLIFIRFVLHFNVHIYFIDQTTHPLLSTLIQLVIFAMFVPWAAATMVVQLHDLELRKQVANG